MIESQRLTTNEMLALLNRVGIPLANYVNVQSRGLKIGLDNVYVLRKSGTRFFSNFLERELDIEQEILRETIVSNNVKRYSIAYADLFLIVPYNFSDRNNNVYNEKEMKSKFPLAWDYFQECERKLQDRGTGEQIMRYNNFIKNDLNLIEGKLLIGKANSKQPAFAIKEDDMVVLESTKAHLTLYVSLQSENHIDLWYLLALLNSKVFKFYHKSTTGNTRSNHTRISKKNLFEFPVMVPIQQTQRVFVNLTKMIQFINGKLPTHEINEYVPNSHIVSMFEDLLDAMIYELYFEDFFKISELSILSNTQLKIPEFDEPHVFDPINIIHNLYQELRSKENQINANLKLMNIRLQNLLSSFN